MLIIVLFNQATGEREELGRFDTIDDLSRSFPISTDGSDLALWGHDPREWDVVVFRLCSDGTQKEVTQDPRVYLEDLAHPVNYM